MRRTSRAGFRLVIACCVLWLYAVPGSGIGAYPAFDEFSHPSGFRFWLPDDWKVSAEGDSLSAEDGKGLAAIEVSVPKNIRQFDRAIDDMEKELNQTLKNIRYDKPVEQRLGSIERVLLSGTGVDRESGIEMEFGFGIYHKNGKLLIVFAVTAAEVYDDYEDVFIKILNSVK